MTDATITYTDGLTLPTAGGQGWCATLGVVTVGARVEHVGSLLRPGFLRDARDAYARGELSPAGLKAAEDRAVRGVVAMQEEIGLPVVGDGEMRRESFQSEHRCL